MVLYNQIGVLLGKSFLERTLLIKTMLIVKLGGSVITHKKKQSCFRPEVANNLAKDIKKANRELIVIHGAGSFGHILAKQYKLKDGYKEEDQRIGFALTHAQVQTLNSLVLKYLHANKIPAVSIPPHAIFTLEDHRLGKIDFEIFNNYLIRQLTPVTFGDVVLDKKHGFSICSGDLIMEALAGYFKPDKVIFVIDEDGLYTANPKVEKNAKFIGSATVEDLKFLSTTIDSYPDVTAGMKGKIDTIENIASFGVDTILINGNKEGRLYRALTGKKVVCSIVYGGGK